MPYTNKCPITFEPLTKENAFLIKVPKTNDKNKDIYYYIGDENTLKKLSSCPLTRREGDYYALKLSEKIIDEDVAGKLLKSNDENTLIDDNEVLAKIDTENKFNWQLKTFENKVINSPETGDEDLLAFTDDFDSSDDQNSETQTFEIFSASNRQIISDYKADFFRHPSISIQIFDAILNHNNFARYCSIVNELMKSALLEEHDLLFLFRSHNLISDLNGRYKIMLQNATYAQLTRYVAGFVVLSKATSIIFDLLINGFSSFTCFGILEILLIDRAQDSLGLLFRENKKLDFNSICKAIFVDGPSQLANPSNLYESAKSAVSNTCEFLKTNLSFFHNKFIKSEPVQYEFPEDLADAQRRFSQRLSF